MKIEDSGFYYIHCTMLAAFCLSAGGMTVYLAFSGDYEIVPYTIPSCLLSLLVLFNYYRVSSDEAGEMTLRSLRGKITVRPEDVVGFYHLPVTFPPLYMVRVQAKDRVRIGLLSATIET